MDAGRAFRYRLDKDASFCSGNVFWVLTLLLGHHGWGGCQRLWGIMEAWRTAKGSEPRVPFCSASHSLQSVFVFLQLFVLVQLITEGWDVGLLKPGHLCHGSLSVWPGRTVLHSKNSVAERLAGCLLWLSTDTVPFGVTQVSCSHVDTRGPKWKGEAGPGWVYSEPELKQ